MEKPKSKIKHIKRFGPHYLVAIFIFGGALYLGAYFEVIPTFGAVSFTANKTDFAVDKTVEEDPKPKPFVASHVKTPEQVKGIYMTSWVAGTPSIRVGLVKLIDETEINSVVIDIKDYSGKIAYEVMDPKLKEIGSEEIRVPDMREFIESLHQKGIYVIGRITVFQDPYLTKVKPELAVKKFSNKEEVWKDNKGLSFTDVGAKEVWDYHVAIAKDAFLAGFDELNFDYIRYPSDGPMNDIYYPWSEETVVSKPGLGKSEVLSKFFAYLSKKVRGFKDEQGRSPVISADLFGMTTTNSDDLNIGQKLEIALPYFDYVAPMVYPSHYPATFLGLSNPAAHPYQVVNYSMNEAVKKVNVFDATVASTSPLKLRPWLQDFNLGATYDADKVKAQIKATYDAGLTSWMLWNASNKYTRDALLSE